MPSPFPFRIGYVLDYVCLSGSLPNGGVTKSVFSLSSLTAAGKYWFYSVASLVTASVHASTMSKKMYPSLSPP